MADKPVQDPVTGERKFDPDAPMWQEPAVESMAAQDTLGIEGEDGQLAAVEHMQGPKTTAIVQGTLAAPGMRTIDADLPNEVMWSEAQQDGVALGREQIAENLDPEAITNWSVAVPDKTDEVLSEIRMTYRERRQWAAREIVRYGLEDSVKERLVKAVAEHPALPTLMGAAQPLTIPQQTLFGLLTGEGWSAFSRFHPSYVIDDDIVDENGVPEEISPWAAAVNTMWLDTTRADEETQEHAMKELRSVTGQWEEEIIMGMDLPDKWAGKENMDQVYLGMLENGFWGKIDMGLTAVGYAGVDIFADPLLAAERLPVLAVKGLRRLTSTVFRAAKAEELVVAEAKSLESLQRGVTAAEQHLDHALRKAQIAADKGAVQIDDLRNVEMAKKFHQERLDELNFRKRPDNNVDTVHLVGPERRNPTSVETIEVMQDLHQMEFPGFGRDWKPGESKSWRLGLEADHRAELHIDDADVNDGVAAFHMIYGENGLSKRTLSELKVGKNAIGNKNAEALAVIEDLAEGMGVRVIPYDSPGYVGRPGNLKGSHFGSSRTAYVNVHYDGTDMISTFIHESWHHIVSKTLSEAQHGELIDNLMNAGFALGKYQDKINSSGSYNLNRAAGVVEEYTARSTSEMMGKPEFWETLARLNPEAYDKLGSSAAEMAIKMQDYIDNVGGRRPSRWIDGTEYPAGDELSRISPGASWYEHNQKVLAGIESAHGQVATRRLTRYDQALGEVNETLLKMVDERDTLEGLGKNVRVNNKEIAALEKYRDRLEQGGVSELMQYPAIKRRYARTRGVEEVRLLAEAERRAALRTPTTDIQPRPDITDGKAGTRYDAAEMPDRVAMGPDDAEVAAEGIGLMVHGAGPDDITMRLNHVPERSAMTQGRIVPGTVDNLIDEDQLKATLKAFKDRAKERQYTLAEFDPEKALVDEAYRIAKAKEGYKPGGLKFDDRWLPQPRKSTGQLMKEGWYDTYQSSFFDQIGNGLYPNTWGLKGPGLLRAAWMWNREPMRVMNAVDPGSWRILRGATLNVENETMRMSGLFNEAGVMFGAVTIDKPSTLRKLFTTNAKETVRVNKEASMHLMRLMEMDPKTKAYAEAMKELTVDQRVAMATIRKELNNNGKRFGLIEGAEGSGAFTKDYMPHVFDAELFSKGGSVPGYAGMSENGNVFMAHLLAREGKEGYNPDAMAALEVYSRAAARKMHLEPALKRIKMRAEAIVADPARQRDSFYLPYIEMMIKAYKGESSMGGALVDRAAAAMVESGGHNYRKGTVGRKVMSLTGLLYSSLLAGNRRYPVMAVSTALATTGAQYGMFRTTRGLFKMATPEGQLIYNNMGGQKTWGKIFEASDSGGIKIVDKITHGLADLHLASPSIQSTENFIRATTMWAAIDEHLTQMGFKTIREAANAGFLEEIMFDSLLVTESSNHFFGIGSKPPWMGRVSKSGSAAGTQFLSFTPKQSEQLLHLAGKNPGHIASFLMLSGWIARVGTEELGVSLDEYVGAQSIQFDSRNTISPAFQTLLKAAVYMDDYTAMMGGYGDAEETTRSGDDLIKSIEMMIPLLNRSREFAQSATATARGEMWSPTQGKVRDMDLKYMDIGGMEVPRLGMKGDRGEAVASAMGVRSAVEKRNQDARKEINREINRVAVERLELVEQAQTAMRKNDWEGFEKQIQKMADAGYPIPNVGDTLVNAQTVDSLGWIITALRRNPELRHKMIPILQKHGLAPKEEEYMDAEDQR